VAEKRSLDQKKVEKGQATHVAPIEIRAGGIKNLRRKREMKKGRKGEKRERAIGRKVGHQGEVTKRSLGWISNWEM